MSRADRILMPLMLALLLAAPAVRALLNADRMVRDSDVYWHIEAGRWIVARERIPDADPFSSHGQSKPWIAYSWLFEILIYECWHAAGLAGIAVYSAAMMFLIAVALMVLLLKMRPTLFVLAIAILMATWGSAPVCAPRPWLFSILFFILELDILLTAGRTGRHGLLWLLPPLFVLWANIHVQFVLGEVVVGLALVESLAASLLRSSSWNDRWQRVVSWLEVREAAPVPLMGAVVAVCVLATLINPYHVGVYEAVFGLLRDQKLWNYLDELQAMRFRDYSHWAVLGATLAAVFCFGWRRRLRLLLVLVLALGLWTSFRSARDVWVVLIAALAVLTDTLGPAAGEESPRLTALGWITVGGAAVLLTALAALPTLAANDALHRDVSQHYPDEACAHVLAHHYRGPLFNHYDWGGYLMWRLHDADPPLPVGMDGRAIVYGQDLILRQIHSWLGLPGWQHDPDLRAANLVIADRNTALASLLKCQGELAVVYEDEVAVVFVRR